MADAPPAKPTDPAKRSRHKPKRSPVGASPGTLIADPNAQPPVLTLTTLSPEGSETLKNATLNDVRKAQRKWPTVWLDCSGLGDVAVIEAIGALFDIHPLALEDVVNTGQRPKTDFFEHHAFVVLGMIDDPAAHRLEQISVLFGKGFVVTFQERSGDPFDPVRKRIVASVPNRLRSKKADYLAYALIDAVVDSYFPLLEGMGDRIDLIEDDMLAAPRKQQASELHLMRRNAGVLKRALWPMRDAIAALARSDSDLVASDTKIYINDTYDHAISLLEMVETQRDTLTGLIDMHLGLSQARTNDIISFLTIVSAIFIPLTFLAGIWGMNFDPAASPWNMPELEAYYGYPAALGFMALVAIAAIGYFKWRRWL